MQVAIWVFFFFFFLYEVWTYYVWLTNFDLFLWHIFKCRRFVKKTKTKRFSRRVCVCVIRITIYSKIEFHWNENVSMSSTRIYISLGDRWCVAIIATHHPKRIFWTNKLIDLTSQKFNYVHCLRSTFSHHFHSQIQTKIQWNRCEYIHI